MEFLNYSFHTPTGKLISNKGNSFDIHLPKNFYTLKTFWNYSGKNIEKKETYFTNPISSIDDKIILWKKSGFGVNATTIKVDEFLNKAKFDVFKDNWNKKNNDIKITYQYIIIALGKEGLYKIYTRSYENCWEYFDNSSTGDLTKFFPEKQGAFNILNFLKISEINNQKFSLFLESEKNKVINWYKKIQSSGNEIEDPIQYKEEIESLKKKLSFEKKGIEDENLLLKKRLNEEKDQIIKEKIKSKILEKENEKLKKELEEKEIEFLSLNPSFSFEKEKKDFTFFIFGNSQLSPEKIKRLISKNIEKNTHIGILNKKYVFSIEIISAKYDECKKEGITLLNKVRRKKYGEYAILIGAEPHSIEDIKKKSSHSFLPILEKEAKQFLIDIRKNQIGLSLDSFKKSNLKSSTDSVLNKLTKFINN